MNKDSTKERERERKQARDGGVPPPPVCRGAAPALGSLDLRPWPLLHSGRTLGPEPVLTSPLLSDVGGGRLDEAPSPYQTGFDGQILGHGQGG